MIEWQWSTFSSLSNTDIYAILKARQDVFVLEQACLYTDIDNADQEAWHLLGWYIDKGDVDNKRLCAYLRVLPPNETLGIAMTGEPSIGRILTVEEFRGQGIGKQLLRRGVESTRKQYPHYSIKVSAQVYLQNFYQGFGFEIISRPYNEDGISHIDMRLHADKLALSTSL